MKNFNSKRKQRVLLRDKKKFIQAVLQCFNHQQANTQVSIRISESEKTAVITKHFVQVEIKMMNERKLQLMKNWWTEFFLTELQSILIKAEGERMTYLGLANWCRFSKSCKYRIASATLLTSCCSCPGFPDASFIVRKTSVNSKAATDKRCINETMFDL